MITLEFNLYPDEGSYWNRTSCSIELDEDMHIAQLHQACCRFAVLLGFHPDTVKEYFGEEADED